MQAHLTRLGNIHVDGGLLFSIQQAVSDPASLAGSPVFVSRCIPRPKPFDLFMPVNIGGVRYINRKGNIWLLWLRVLGVGLEQPTLVAV
jgi:hypothetical protein